MMAPYEPLLFPFLIVVLYRRATFFDRIQSTWGDEEENKLSYKRKYKYIYATFKCVRSCHTWQIKTFRGNLVFESHMGTNAPRYAFV